MNCNVPVAEAINEEVVLAERVQEALGRLVGAAKEGLLALSVEVGLGVLRELLAGGPARPPPRRVVVFGCVRSGRRGGGSRSVSSVSIRVSAPVFVEPLACATAFVLFVIARTPQQEDRCAERTIDHARRRSGSETCDSAHRR